MIPVAVSRIQSPPRERAPVGVVEAATSAPVSRLMAATNAAPSGPAATLHP